ncbi:30S ribosomal protein S21 domain protein [Cooperia oncophora]
MGCTYRLRQEAKWEGCQILSNYEHSSAWWHTTRFCTLYEGPTWTPGRKVEKGCKVKMVFKRTRSFQKPKRSVIK